MSSDVKPLILNIPVPKLFGVVPVNLLGFKMTKESEQAAIRELEERIAAAKKLGDAQDRAVRAISNARIPNADGVASIVRKYAGVPNITLQAAKAKYDETKSPAAKELYESLAALKALQSPKTTAQMQRLEDEAQSIPIAFIASRLKEKLTHEDRPKGVVSLSEVKSVPELQWRIANGE